MTALLINSSQYTHTVDIAILDLIPYAVLAVVMTLYPVSGFIADVCCGRFKVAMISLALFLFSLLFLVLACFLNIPIWASTQPFFNRESGEYFALLIVIFVSLSLICFVCGLTGYQANYIQLGLDQLFEAPHEYLALFIHYATWAFSLGSVIVPTLISIGMCESLQKKERLSALLTLPSLLAILLFILFMYSWCKKQAWSNIDPGQRNPYKTVYKIINFARKHKHPLQRSAFTYSDDEIPNRLDFAKERYGGPYTTEEVENVKTLIRVILLLLAIGPTHILSVASSHYIFPLFSIHIY